MEDVAAPKALVVDGANVATSNRGTPSLARLESAIGALRAAIPAAECLVLVTDDVRPQLDEEERARLDELVASQLIALLPPDVRGGPRHAILAAAEASDATVVSNDSFHQERDAFPWLRDVARLLGHSYGGDGWWVFTTRGATGHISWTGHDAVAPAAASGRSAITRAVDTVLVRDGAASRVAVDAGAAPEPDEVSGPGPEGARTYEDLAAWAPPALAIVPHGVVQDAVAVLFSSSGPRARDDLVAELVAADLGLSMYGAAALLYRFEGAGIAREIEPGTLERSSDLAVRTAIDRVCDDILDDLLTHGAKALGDRDVAAARRALGLAPGARPREAPPKEPARAESPPKQAATKAPKARAPAKKKAPAARAPAKKQAPAARAPAKKQAPATGATVKAEKAATQAPAPAGVRSKPRVRSGPSGVEWVARCPKCGREIVAKDRATATSKLAAHRCRR
jgi:hypothetical protein